jgi:putative ABC transport system permease protein
LKSLTRGHLKTGLDSVRGAKLRNFWTILGIIIGVTSVISVVSIGEGIKYQISQQIRQFGKDLITVQPEQLRAGSGLQSSSISLLSGSNIVGSLNEQDISAVGKAHGVAESAPLSVVSGSVKGYYGYYNKGIVFGTTSDLPNLLDQTLAYGDFLEPGDQSNDAVLGQSAAQALFNEDVPLGRSFTFHGQQFIVSGIFNEFNNTPLTQEADFNNAIFIPYDVAASISNGGALTYEILAKPYSYKQTEASVKNIRKSLSLSNGGDTNFSVLEQSQDLSSSSAVLDLLTQLIAGVAAISLLVGGIGIMNVMFVSVAERMHEIGIRKAVGATNRQILSQFMVEASVLSLVGGVCGIVLSFVIDICLRLFTNLTPIISWQVVALATGVSLLIGVIFGTVPAVKAARRDPIDALRSE